jgi:hypothetical protein
MSHPFQIIRGGARHATAILSEIVFGGGGGLGSFIQRVDSPGHRQERGNASKDINKLIPRRSWKALQTHSRFIYQNFGPVAGAAHDKSNFAIGNAWRFYHAGEDDDWAELAEERLNSWSRIGDVRGHPYDFQTNWWIGSVALEHSGDFFVLLTRNRAGFPRYQIIPSHRVQSGSGGDGLIKTGRYKGAEIINGVIYSARNEVPIAYRVCGSDGKERDYSNRDLYPVYDPKWFGQGRGIPLLSYSLGDWDDAFEIRDAEKTSVEANAALAIVEYNETGSVDTANAYMSDGDGQAVNEDAIRAALAKADEDGSGSGSVEIVVEEEEPMFFHELREKGGIRYMRAARS